MRPSVVCCTLDAYPKVGGGGPGGVLTQLVEGIRRAGGIEVTALSPPGPPVSWRPRWRQRTDRLTSWLNRTLAPGAYLAGQVARRSSEAERFLLEHAAILDAAAVIHAHDIYAFAGAWRLRARRDWTAPLLLSIHSPGSTVRELAGTRGVRWRRRILRRSLADEAAAIHRCTRLVLPSRGAFEMLEADLAGAGYEIGAFQQKLVVLHTGIADVDVPPADASRVRQEIRCDPDAFVVLFAGRLVPLKGAHTLLEAMTRLVATSGPVQPSLLRLVIAGDGPERARLERAAGRLRVAPYVTFLGWRHDVPALMAAASLVCSPGLRAAFDLVVLQALRAGRPLVVSDIYGNKEAVTPEVGVRVPPEDPRALADVLLTLMHQPATRSRLGQRARATYEERFTHTAMARSYAHLIGELLAAFPTR